MLDSKTLNDLVACYKAAKSSGDSQVTLSAEAALSSFAHAEASVMTMRVNEAVAAGVSGFRVGG
jgi:hypothetical protein